LLPESQAVIPPASKESENKVTRIFFADTIVILIPKWR
jgi:hypothetical protein